MTWEPNAGREWCDDYLNCIAIYFRLICSNECFILSAFFKLQRGQSFDASCTTILVKKNIPFLAYGCFFCKNKDTQCDFMVCAQCYTAMEKEALTNIEPIPKTTDKLENPKRSGGRQSSRVLQQSVRKSTRKSIRVQDAVITTSGSKYKTEKEKTEARMKELYTATGEALCVFDHEARQLLHWTYSRLETITDTYWIDPAYHNKLREKGQDFCLPTGCKQCKKIFKFVT
jgi:hypothetical protein